MRDAITKIAVEGFKSIASRQEIEIRPLTILAGANSSGKSSIMQPLLMLKQTLEAPYDPGPLKLDGPNVTFTRTDEFLSRVGESPDPRLRIEIATDSLGFDATFSRTREPGLDLTEVTYRFMGSSVTLRPEMSLSDLRDALSNFAPLKQISHQQFSIARRRFYLNLKRDEWSPLVPLEYGSEYIEELIHVPGRRGHQGRTYGQSGTGPRFPGTFDHYVANVILQWQKNARFDDAGLNRDLQNIQIAQSILAHRVSDVAIELRVGLREGRPYDLDNIADVGFGVSQVLPVLVALRVAEEGRLVYLEEPEIHLHPRAQTNLAEILAGAANRGVRVVAETHSSLLLTAIQTLVAKGELSPNLVKLHWFQRDPGTGITKVTSADLDENGAFGDWPEDFGDVALRSEQNYLDAVETKLAR